MSERPPIEGQVARILNARELAINRGSEHGVAEGMVFDVLDPNAEDITDPETGEELGSVYRPKVQVKAFVVQDKLSLCRTFKSERVNVGGTGALSFARAFEPPKWVVRHETLKTDESTWENLDESESFVKTGDPVVEVVEELEEADVGSRTLEQPDSARQVARQFEERVANWLDRDGWRVSRSAAQGDPGFDLVGERDGERLIVEAKWRRRPLSAADIAEAVGWAELARRRGDAGSGRVFLIVSEAGVSEAALKRLTELGDLLEVYREEESGNFERIV